MQTNNCRYDSWWLILYKNIKQNNMLAFIYYIIILNKKLCRYIVSKEFLKEKKMYPCGQRYYFYILIDKVQSPKQKIKFVHIFYLSQSQQKLNLSLIFVQFHLCFIILKLNNSIFLIFYLIFLSNFFAKSAANQKFSNFYFFQYYISNLWLGVTYFYHFFAFFQFFSLKNSFNGST